jgi:hypothetical protein
MEGYDDVTGVELLELYGTIIPHLREGFYVRVLTRLACYSAVRSIS